ncbi:MAG: UDP-N-acetylmuramoyl-L-alanine--D-glutamate ligase [Thermoanaerobaculum sp.]|nr:UDP-N-acetylmuramoyl-L-alanine--D-glutamate ligase [Thermoanaerobaculum sp.]
MNTPSWRRALVVGLGISGVDACRLLRAQGVAVRATDQASREALAFRLAEIPPSVEVRLGDVGPEVLDGVDVVVVSPGVPPQAPLLQEARGRGLEVIPEVELAFRFAGDTPIVGITGSNGKSTVTDLVGQILKTAGFQVAVGANLGPAASGIVLRGNWDVMVWELSSFQLELITTLRPKIAVFLNLSPDHLDRHGSLEAYLAAKAKIFAHQGPEDHAVVNADDPWVAPLAVPSQRHTFSLRNPEADAYYDGSHLMLQGRVLMARQALRLPGDHNVANALAAALACRLLGLERETLVAGLRQARSLPHRHELVAEIGGVRYVDDSKGTNVGAVVAGLLGYPDQRVHLILGGLGKGQDFRPLVPAVQQKVRRAYLIGQAAQELWEVLAPVLPCELCGTLDEAVRRAAACASPGDVVLLSPACASFDQFRDYAHRGHEFARLVQSLGGADA